MAEVLKPFIAQVNRKNINSCVNRHGIIKEERQQKGIFVFSFDLRSIDILVCSFCGFNPKYITAYYRIHHY
ncbi:MAG TPA: hypothetical protein PLX23_02380 [Candidatus Hydrogenedens sp.]|nr:hypothetical protein [Candidatus Hydrogenedens sp.]